MPQPEMLSPADVARYAVGASSSTIRDHIRRGKLPATRMRSGHYYVWADHAKAWAEINGYRWADS